MKRVIRTLALSMVVGALVVGGCLPIELSVSNDGRIIVPREEGFCIIDQPRDKASAKVVYSPKPNKPAFAIFAPDGKRFLAISQAEGGGMGAGFEAQVVDTDGANPKPLFKATNLTYARWSPDAKFVSVTRLADKQSAAIGENLPEQILVDAATGAQKTLASDVSVIHRWFPDSKHVLALQIASKNKDKDQYVGKLVKIDAATGKAQPLASVLSGKELFFDLSPDGRKALLVVIAVAGPDKEVPAQSDEESQLYELDIETGAVRAVKEGVLYAVYSPKGGRVLIGAAKAERGDGLELAVSNAAFKEFKTVAADAAKSAGDGTDSRNVYPGWLDEDTVHYIAQRTVFGTVGKNLQLTIVGADGEKRTNLQSVVDGAAR